MKTYETYCFKNKPQWDRVPFGEISCYQWNSEAQYRTFFKMCLVENEGIYVKMNTDEKNIRAVNTKRDEPVWEDSCMEFFFSPFSHRKEYLNFEINPKGAYLCQWGKGKTDRVFAKELTQKELSVKTCTNENGWSLELFVPCSFISEVYSEAFKAESGAFKGNFYKCGDKTEKVHYGSFAKMTTLPPGFHNPQCFAEIIVKNENQFGKESHMINLETVEVCRCFNIKGEPISCENVTGGHINSTNLVTFNEGGKIKKYLVQGINTHVFRNPDNLMNNIVNVTQYLKTKIKDAGGDPDRETLTFLPAKDGRYYYYYNDKCWRIYYYVDNSYTLSVIENSAAFENAGKSFGMFQRHLSDYPMSNLFETIKDFHNTPKRLETLKNSVDADVKGRAASVKKEIDFALEREADAKIVLDLHKKGLIPLRVTHNDTKLNNILFDTDTNESICVIDLDTIMPGLSLYDFGDAIRFGGNTTYEDDPNLENVKLSVELFESFARGFLSSCAKALTKTEVDYLAFSAKLMTFECGVRFLTDYLDGDVYFKTKYEDHNLVRARNQFKLVEEIENHLDEMNAIVEKLYNEFIK